VFIEHPPKGSTPFGLEVGEAHLGGILLLDGIRVGVTSVMF
jgi:hypothetical protein